jgi:mono/diheme cytochrome c family protein
MREHPAARQGLRRLLGIALLVAGLAPALALDAQASAAIWDAKCDICHGASPSGARANAANAASMILNAQNNVSDMAGVSLTASERTSLATYIESVINTTPRSLTTSYNANFVLNVGGVVALNTNASHLTTFVTVDAPAKGTLTYNTATPSITYNPNACQTGSDSFQYRVRNAGDTLTTATRQVNVTINNNPPIPTISSAAAKTSTFNIPASSYTIASTVYPCPSTTTFGASNLPPGITRSGAVLSGTPTDAGTYNVTLSATNATGTDTQTLVWTINKATQLITFPAQTTPRNFSTSTFAISPLATSSSGLTPVYSSGSPTVCTVSGTTVTMLTSGNCILEANQAGNGNYNPAPEVTRTVVINGTVPGAPTGVSAAPGTLQATVSFTAPVNKGGSNIASYTATCTASGQPTRTSTGAGSPRTVTNMLNGVTYACSVTATNATGTGPASASVNVIPSAAPVAPTFTSANTGQLTVGIAGFFLPEASGNPVPTITLFSGTPPTGVTFNGSTLSGTPASGTAGTYNLTFRATNSQGFVDQPFTLTVVKQDQAITFAQPATPRAFSLAPVPLTVSSSSGLTVALTPADTNVCTISSGNAVMQSIGTCVINAAQAGNGTFNAAPGLARSFVIDVGDQAITFGAQVTPRAFVQGGTFAISPVATSSSNLPVAHASTTPAVCTVSGTTVTMVASGLCTLAANQAGNGNWNPAPQVTQGITINATAPGAPSIGTATPGNGQATISFTPPANSGGSPITGYTVTCNPGGFNASGPDSPLTVTGLSNGTPYACSVQATNAVGTGSASASANVTPGISGAQLWQSTCTGCHGVEPPSGARFNAAGVSGTVLSYVRANQPLMAANAGVQGLTPAELQALAVYIAEQVPLINVTALQDTPKAISVASHLRLGTVSFEDVEVVSPPSVGLLSAFTGTSATYTPPPGFTGQVTFSYRGRRTTPVALFGDPRMVTIDVTADAMLVSVNRTGTGAGTVTSEPMGISCAGTCADAFPSGSKITLTALPTFGSVFAGWTGVTCGEGNADMTCTFGLSSPVTNVTAQFNLEVPPLPPLPIPGDLSGEGRADLVFQNADGRIAAWLMNGTAVTSSANLIGAGAGWSVTHLADLNADGKAEIFFKHTDGRVYVYVMNGLAVTAGKELLGAGLGWSISHTADLNLDRKADLILRNADGRHHLWLMDGTAIIGSVSLLPAGSGWNVAGTGDLNGDGKADIVFMHDDGRGYIYLMDGTTIIGGAGFLSPGSGWTVSHVADIDGDGKADLVFRHTDGRAHLFLMNGTSFGAGLAILGPGTGWIVSHVGDLNGDGRGDFVFRHTDGRAHVRLMNGTSVLGAGDILPAGAGWTVTQLLDLNGDGRKDLVFRNTNGSITVRLMDGLTILGSANLLGVGAWSVVPNPGPQ